MDSHFIDELSSCISYEPESGKLFWKKRTGHRIKVGDEAGGIRNGYRQINFMGKRYPCHRIVWLLAYGSWPKNFIDHIDGDRLNNRLPNLRDVTLKENNQNKTKASCISKTGLLGASRGGRGFVGRIFRDGVKIHLGVFDTANEAHQAYLEAKRALDANPFHR